MITLDEYLQLAAALQNETSKPPSCNTAPNFGVYIETKVKLLLHFFLDFIHSFFSPIKESILLQIAGIQYGTNVIGYTTKMGVRRKMQ